MAAVASPTRTDHAPSNGLPPERAAVDARTLTKTFPGGVCAVKSVSLQAGLGEIVGVVGPNGAGKSTTLEMLATLLRPSSGEAQVCGIPIADARRVRPLLGVSLQEVGLDPLMTGKEHFRVQAALSRLDSGVAKRRAERLVERLGLAPFVDRLVGAYSGGTQRRLDLALALLAEPKVLIFDEPTAGLDPRARRDIWEIVRELKDAGHTLLFSTQYLEEADSLCDRIYFIDHGAIVAAGTPGSLKRDVAAKTLEIVLADDAEADAVASLDSLPVQNIKVNGNTVVLKLDRAGTEPVALLQLLKAHGMAMQRFTLASASLDDVFFHHTRHGLEPEPLEKPSMDLGTRMHRGAGKRWN